MDKGSGSGVLKEKVVNVEDPVPTVVEAQEKDEDLKEDPSQDITPEEKQE